MSGTKGWLAALVAALVAAAGSVPNSQAAFPGENGRIAAEESGAIFLIDPVTGSQTELGPGQYPAWSADGTRIAYQTLPTSDIHVVNADGTADTRLTDHPREDASPSWSPDGTRIAFVSGRLGGLDVYVMNADGSGVTRLTRYFEDNGFAYAPAWSPDGRRIAYIGQRGHGLFSHVHVMNADGSEDVAITDGLDPARPKWAPDGSRILFSGADQGSRQFYTVRPDGSDLQPLPNARDESPGTPREAHVFEPTFSPDGLRIVFGIGGCRFPDVRCGSDVVSQRLDGTDRRIEAGAADREFWSAPDWGIRNSPPDCGSVFPHPAILWPPNNRFRTVTLSGGRDPDGDDLALAVTGVTHDEGGGPGWKPGPSPHQVRLRAKRDPRGDGRVYTISFEATDEHGATCTGDTTVTVPRHKNRELRHR